MLDLSVFFLSKSRCGIETILTHIIESLDFSKLRTNYLMKKYIALVALLSAGTPLSFAVIELSYKPGSGTGYVEAKDNHLTAVSEWGYFWNIYDQSGLTRPENNAGNAYANGGVYNAITTADNSEYNLSIAEDYTININESVYFNSVSSTATNLTLAFGSSGSITTAQNINFGQGSNKSLSISVVLSEEEQNDISTAEGVATRVLLQGNANYGIWNYSEIGTKSLVLVGLEGYSFNSNAKNISDLQAGEYGLFYSDTGTVDKISFAVKSVLAVPEPSAFGLFAGLSALVLVASRRRRR